VSEVPPVLHGPDRPAPRFGWVLCFLVFLGLVSITLVAQFGPSESSDRSALSRVDMALRTQVKLMTALKQLSPQQSQSSQQQSANTLLSLVDESDATRLAQEVYRAVIRHEYGVKQDARALAALQESKRRSERAIGKLYATAKPNPKDAPSIQSAIVDEQGYGFRVAEMHLAEKQGKSSARQGLVHSGTLVMLGFLALGGLACLILVPTVWLVFVMMRSSGKLPPAGIPALPLTDRGADRLAWAVGLSLSCFVLLQIAMGPVLRNLESSFANVLLFAIQTGAVLLIFKGIARSDLDFGLHRIGFGRISIGKSFLWGAGGAIANVPIFFIAAQLGQWAFRGLPSPQHPVSEELMATKDPLMVVSILLAAAVIVPIWEEIVFRGGFFPALTHVMRSPIASAILTSLLFAAIHPTGIPSWPALMTVALMTCFLNYQTGSVVPGIIMHGIHNGTLLFISLALL
jgi:membrane protease YdiL (CAAX protease family)